MDKISIKGILLGTLTTLIVNPLIQFIFIAISPFLLRHHILSVADNHISSYDAVDFILANLPCILAGYVSARVAKHHEILNGAMTSMLAVGICLFVYVYTHNHAVWTPLLVISTLIVLSGFGGYLRLLQVHAQTRRA